MKSAILIFAALAIAGCSAQGAIDDADFVCKDGVEYFVYSKMSTSGSVGYSVVPHYKNSKGEIYGCDRMTGWREAISGPRQAAPAAP